MASKMKMAAAKPLYPPSAEAPKMAAKAPKKATQGMDRHMGSPHKGPATSTLEQSASGAGLGGHSKDGHQFDAGMKPYHHDGVEHNSGHC